MEHTYIFNEISISLYDIKRDGIVIKYMCLDLEDESYIPLCKAKDLPEFIKLLQDIVKKLD